MGVSIQSLFPHPSQDGFAPPTPARFARPSKPDSYLRAPCQDGHRESIPDSHRNDLRWVSHKQQWNDNWRSSTKISTRKSYFERRGFHRHQLIPILSKCFVYTCCHFHDKKSRLYFFSLSHCRFGAHPSLSYPLHDVREGEQVADVVDGRLAREKPRNGQRAGPGVQRFRAAAHAARVSQVEHAGIGVENASHGLAARSLLGQEKDTALLATTD